MKCRSCGKLMFLSHPVIVDGKTDYICTDCKVTSVKVGLEIDRQIEDHMKPYILKWKLRDKVTGECWIEEHREMTLADFEVVYGANVHEVIWLIVRKDGYALL